LDSRAYARTDAGRSVSDETFLRRGILDKVAARSRSGSRSFRIRRALSKRREFFEGTFRERDALGRAFSVRAARSVRGERRPASGLRNAIFPFRRDLVNASLNNLSCGTDLGCAERNEPAHPTIIPRTGRRSPGRLSWTLERARTKSSSVGKISERSSGDRRDMSCVVAKRSPDVPGEGRSVAESPR